MLEHLRLTRGATVRELCSVLGLTATGVRQHLTILEHEGLVDSEEVRGRVGRPAHRFALTRRGDAMFPQGYDDLGNALIEEIRARYGPEGLQSIVGGVAARLTDRHVPALEELAPEQRVQATVASSPSATSSPTGSVTATSSCFTNAPAPTPRSPAATPSTAP